MTRLGRINREIKLYDRQLYAVQSTTGLIQIMRNNRRWDVYILDGKSLIYGSDSPHLILNLSRDWGHGSDPADWGLEPLVERLRDMDQWRDDSSYDKMVKQRELVDENKKRALKNDMRARALDLRRDFAKATNDINVSNL